MHGGGAGVLNLPAPQGAASSDGRQMGLDKKLICTAVEKEDLIAAMLVPNQVNVSGHTQLSSTSLIHLKASCSVRSLLRWPCYAGRQILLFHKYDNFILFYFLLI